MIFMDLYLALDIGTSSAKCSIVNENGVLIHSLSQSYAPVNPRPNWVEQDPNDWWRATQSLCNQAKEDIDLTELKAITVTGQTPSCVPIDKKGFPVTNAILWLDRRASEDINRINSLINNNLKDSHQLGNRIDSYFGGVKWIWFMLNQPEQYQKTWKILQANNYITYKLTGEIVIDHTQAGLCTPFYNFTGNQWEYDFCENIGFDQSKLPDIITSESVIGYVTRDAAEFTGLPMNTPVVCGAADFSLACLGTGINKENTASIMLGTAGNLMMPNAKKTDNRLINSIYLSGEKLVFGGVLAGRNITWFLGLFNNKDPDMLNILTQKASSIDPGSEGLIYLPYLNGERTPIWDANARGVYFGLSTQHRQGHLFRAILEGTSFALREIAEIFSESGSPIEAAIVIDGGSKNKLWKQIISDILQIPITTGSANSGTQLGAAFLCALAIGNRKHYFEINEWLETGLTTHPNPDKYSKYNRLYEGYKNLYQNVKDLYRFL